MDGFGVIVVLGGVVVGGLAAIALLVFVGVCALLGGLGGGVLVGIFGERAYLGIGRRLVSLENSVKGARGPVAREEQNAQLAVLGELLKAKGQARPPAQGAPGGYPGGDGAGGFAGGPGGDGSGAAPGIMQLAGFALQNPDIAKLLIKKFLG